jgi:nitrilase
VSPTRLGKLGMLICGENTNPLARYALMAQGEQVHMSSYPPIWPTRPPEEEGAYDLRRAIEIRAGAHAFEAKVYNIVASGFVDAAMREALSNVSKSSLDIIDRSPRGVSMVIDPSCNVVGDTLSEHEGILYADIDTGKGVEPKQFHDVVGYYNRFDIFDLRVNRTPLKPAHFVDAVVSEHGEPENRRAVLLNGGDSHRPPYEAPELYGDL